MLNPISAKLSVILKQKLIKILDFEQPLLKIGSYRDLKIIHKA